MHGAYIMQNVFTASVDTSSVMWALVELNRKLETITINYPHSTYPIDLFQIQVMGFIHLKSMHKSKKSCSFLLFLKITNFSNYGELNK